MRPVVEKIVVLFASPTKQPPPTTTLPKIYRLCLHRSLHRQLPWCATKETSEAIIGHPARYLCNLLVQVKVDAWIQHTRERGPASIWVRRTTREIVSPQKLSKTASQLISWLCKAIVSVGDNVSCSSNNGSSMLDVFRWTYLLSTTDLKASKCHMWIQRWWNFSFPKDSALQLWPLQIYCSCAYLGHSCRRTSPVPSAPVNSMKFSP